MIRAAFKDLEKNFRVLVQEDTDYIELSMTSGDQLEAALIVNPDTPKRVNAMCLV